MDTVTISIFNSSICDCNCHYKDHRRKRVFLYPAGAMQIYTDMTDNAIKEQQTSFCTEAVTWKAN